MNSRITPSESFPEDLRPLPESEVEVLNSKLHRELNYEYVHDGEPSSETESRLEDVTEELDRRDNADERAGDAESIGSVALPDAVSSTGS